MRVDQPVALVRRAILDELLDFGGSGQNAGGIQIGPADEFRIAGGGRRRNVQDLEVMQDVVVNVIVPRRLLEDRLLQFVRKGMRKRENVTWLWYQTVTGASPKLCMVTWP